MFVNNYVKAKKILGENGIEKMGLKSDFKKDKIKTSCTCFG